MPRSRPYPAALVLLAVLAAALIAGCGAGASSGPAATASTNPRQLLRDTFSPAHQARSASFTATFAASGAGAAEAQNATVAGAFERTDSRTLPKFSVTASSRGGAGHAVQGGATWTGEQGYVAYRGAQYAVPALVAQQFQAGYEEALKRGASPAALGIDPSRWLRDPRNAGVRRVAGVDTIEVTGAGDPSRALADIQRLSARARALGVPGSAPMTARERAELLRSIKHMTVSVYTGKADRILRRLVVDVDGRGARGRALHVAFRLTFTGVGQAQDIAAPPHAKPFSDLLAKLGAAHRNGR